ncbi:MAG: hypothetical protein AB2794_21605 [Candidatus Thiodiazotropha endolucinida]
MNTWRDNPFIEGKKYKVIKDFHQSQSIFKAGEILIYVNSEYSHYDNSTIFFFKAKGDHPKTWWLHDDEPIEEYKKLFLEIE